MRCQNRYAEAKGYGVDAASGLIHSVESTAANVHGLNTATERLHGDERLIYGDAGHIGYRCIVAALATALLLIAGCARGSSSRQGNAALREYYDQTLAWHACGGTAPADAECATLRVPRDYRAPRAAAWTIAVARLPASSAGARLGAIVTNPGGPGIAGISDLLSSDDFYDKLRTRYDVVTFDPRGVGASTPALHCLEATQVAAIRDQVSAPTSAQDQALAFSLARAHGAACETASDDNLDFLGTRDVARDMDVLRAALGEERLDYLGFSYGTYLGATYAELFPGLTDRFVLDSVMNPANSYERLRYDQALAQQASIERFVADCPTHEDCPLAAEPAAALAQIAGVVAALDAEPYVGADQRVLSGSRAQQLIESSMYTPEDGWPALRAVLGPTLAGDFEPLLAAAYGPGLLVNPADSPYLAVLCHDLQVGRDAARLPALAAEWKEAAPLTGAGRAWSVLQCVEWPRRANVAPATIAASGSGDILVVGVTGDPATPVAWARALAGRLRHGHLLEWQGDGHIAYGRGGTCIDDAVEAFFLDGVLPPDGTVCPP